MCHHNSCYHDERCHCRKRRSQYTNRCSPEKQFTQCERQTYKEQTYEEQLDEKCIKRPGHQPYGKPFIKGERKCERTVTLPYDSCRRSYPAKQQGCGCSRCQQRSKRKRYTCSCYES